MNALTQPKLTLEAYLAWENEQAERHEFRRGDVYAMVGGRRPHGRVVSNLNGVLLMFLKGSPYQVFAESMKVQVGEDTVLYPDVFVTCNPKDLATDQLFQAPRLVIEVLSPSTQGCDRSAKFALYRRLPSLQEYVLVDPDTRRIESFRRGADGVWTLHDMTDGPALELASLQTRIPLADVFDGVDPPDLGGA